MVWLPVQLRSESLWTQEVALQEMLKAMDELRDNMDGLKSSNRIQEKEIEMLRTGVNDLARYMRKYSNHMSIDQINDMHSILRDCRDSYNYFKAGKQYSYEQQIDTTPCLQRIFAGLTPAPGTKENGVEKK